jgi:hypothetical protein
LLQRELPLSPRLNSVHGAPGARVGRCLHRRRGLPRILLHHLNANTIIKREKRCLIELRKKKVTNGSKAQIPLLSKIKLKGKLKKKMGLRESGALRRYYSISL